MADNKIGGGGDAFISGLINAAQNQAKALETPGDDASEEALKQALIKKMLAQQKLQHVQHKSHDSLVKDRNAAQRFQDAQTGRAGAGAAAWANAGDLQKKLTAAQRELFLKAATAPETRAQAQTAGEGLAQASRLPNFNAAVPDSRAAGELQHAALSDPKALSRLRPAIEHPYMGDRKADAGTKQNFLQYAAKFGDSRGISIRLGGDMLGTLSGTRVPGFAQQASMRMMSRNPDNVVGVDQIDGFAKDTAAMGVPDMVRGVAIKVLARSDGAPDARAGLQEVTQDAKFGALTDNQQQRWLTTLGQGKAQELRALTDQTLIALRSPDFPAHSAQVSRFLSGLGRQVQKSLDKNGSAAQSVDARRLIKAAKGRGMPALPQLINTQDMDDEEASRARALNRSQVMKYYSSLNAHYDGIDGQIKNAKYFEDVNLLTGLRPAEAIDTQILEGQSEALRPIDSELATLAEDLKARKLTRTEYVDKVTRLQTQTLGRVDLNDDAKTAVYAKTTHALMGQTYLELAGKKNRKMRDVGKNLMPPARRQRLARERRSVQMQPRYFNAVPSSSATGTGRASTLPLPQGGQGLSAQSPVRPGGEVQRGAGQGGLSSRALAAAGAKAIAASSAGSSARIAEVLAGMDPNLDADAKLGQAVTLVAQEMQRQTVDLVTQMFTALSTGVQPPDAVQTPKSLAPIEAIGPKTPKPATSGTPGRTDAYGIPRTFERDLGARAQVVPVRPARAQAADADMRDEVGELAGADHAEARILKPTTQLRDMATLYATAWKELTKPESAVLRNLGWDHATWNAKGSGQGITPSSYRTSFASLNPRQRAAVTALGFSQDEWDASVAAMGGGVRR